MSDKLNELENVVPENEVEEIVETTEEVVETPEDTVEEVVEETAEETVEAVDAVEETAVEVNEYVADIIQEPAKKNTPVAAIVSVVVVVALIAAVAIGIVIDMTGNKYNKMGYVPVSGMTIQDIADEMEMDISEFLTMYNLPADMPADTTQEAAFYNIPLGTFAGMNGIDLEVLKTALNIPAETTVSEPKNIIEKIMRLFKPQKPVPITESTPWGIVLDELTLGSYVGAEQLEEFKTYYELDESVTVDTLYKEVREQIDKKTLELIEEQNAAKEEALDENSEDTNTEDAEGTQEPAENAAQTETDKSTQETPAE